MMMFETSKHVPKTEKRCFVFENNHVHSGKIILGCYVALILQMKDSCSANLTFRAHN